MSGTTYAAVIATRNRRHALELSIPLLLGQARPPEEIVVVDASDDHAAVADLIGRLGAAARIPITCLEAPPGASAQRNLGTARVSADVVLYPDDDSLLYPDAMARVMAVYDRDAGGHVGGVGGDEAFAPPPGVLEDAGGYAMTRSDRLKAAIARPRYALQDRLAPDPLVLCAETVRARREVPLGRPDWLADLGAELVPYNTGFRMSFRRPLIQRIGFEEKLGRYPLFEDIDAALAVQETHLLVAARGAGVYHHKSPERRASGHALGAIQLLNRAYVLARHWGGDPALARAMRAHGRFKIAQYAAGARSRFGRERLAGALMGYRHQMPLLRAAPEALDETYLALRERCLAGRTA